jgi:hypothetical protein
MANGDFHEERRGKDSERKHEEEFRDALIKYMEACEFTTEGSILTDFIVITVETDMVEPSRSTTAYFPSTNTSFPAQVGMLEYIRTMYKRRIINNHNEGE